MTVLDEKLDGKSFIRSYKAAIKSKLSREQFAKILGILPASLRRRRLAIEKQYGLNLPQLASDADSFLSQEDIEYYYTALNELERKEANTVADVKRNVSGFSRYVITSAQNATPVHPGFLASILNYCEENDAQFIVIPYRYKNPTSLWTANNKDQEWWAPSIKEYIVDETVRLSDNTVVLGGVKVQPTAEAPLSGFDGYTGMDSAIIGHPKVQLRTVPTPSQHLPKILTTTGAVTIPNYTDSKAGFKGEFHHSLAALIVEIDLQNNCHIRHVHGDDAVGSFYDIDKLYAPDGVTSGHRIAALITGDSHAEFMDETVLAATYMNEDSIVNTLLPEVIVRHDVEDFYARNHHHRGNDVIAYGKHHFGRDNVEDSLQLTADFLDLTTFPNSVNVIVKSNHDEALNRWLKESDPKFDQENALLYYWLKFNQMKSVKMTSTGFSSMDPFEFWCLNPLNEKGLKNKEQTLFLKRDESFRVHGIELGFHGDIGPNGSRGSIKSFSKIGPKTIIGHSHCLTAGHSVLVEGRGWVAIADIIKGDRVLSYGKEDKNEYVTVTETFANNYTGKILSIGGDRWRQEVTDFHNLYLTDHTYMPVTQAITLRSASEIPLTAQAMENKLGLDISDDEIRRIVAFCADGSVQDGRWVRFQFKKDRKIERMKVLFGDCLTPFSQSNAGTYKTSLITESVYYNEMAKWVSFEDKRLPEKFRMLSTTQKQIFIDELKYWDGTFDTGSNGNQYSTAKSDEADLVSSTLTELGLRNTCKLRWKKASTTGTYHVSWSDNREHNFISEKEAGDKHRISTWQLHIADVQEVPVYCITNDNANFWVKHDATGTVSLTGNSPGIYEGCYQVGVSARLDLEYASGPSSWLHTHCIIYADGARTLVNIIGGKWRLDETPKMEDVGPEGHDILIFSGEDSEWISAPDVGEEAWAEPEVKPENFMPIITTSLLLDAGLEPTGENMDIGIRLLREHGKVLMNREDLIELIRGDKPDLTDYTTR